MSVIDRATFDELKEISGEDFINELIDTFLEDAPKLMEEMSVALDMNNAETFRRAAHSMKSNAATFGAGQLSAVARELEMLGKENKLHETGDRLRALEEAFVPVRDELRNLKS
jgi:HPt (histidine-containing phosphotransfer) domain-containing protein